MTGGGLESVVVVVPALAVSQEGDPPEICGLVAGGERTVTPDVTGGIHQPGGVQHENSAEETAPHHPAHPAQVIEKNQERDRKDDVISVDPAVNRVLVEIGRPLLVVLGRVLRRAINQHPPNHVCPEKTLSGGVSVVLVVRVSM